MDPQTVERFEKKPATLLLAVMLPWFLWFYAVLGQYLSPEHLDCPDRVISPVPKQEVIHADFPVSLDEFDELVRG